MTRGLFSFAADGNLQRSRLHVRGRPGTAPKDDSHNTSSLMTRVPGWSGKIPPLGFVASAFGFFDVFEGVVEPAEEFA